MFTTHDLAYIIARCKYMAFMALMYLLPVFSAVATWWLIHLPPGDVDWLSVDVIAAMLVGTLGIWFALLVFIGLMGMALTLGGD